MFYYDEAMLRNKSYAFFIFCIIILGGYLRLFYLNGNGLPFWTDTARDLLISEKIWNSILHLDLHSLPLQGPSADTYLDKQGYGGAFYYYLLVLPGFMTQFTPLGMGIFTLLLNVLSIYLMFALIKNLHGNTIGLISALMLATSSILVGFSIFLWEPNLYIFFQLLSLVIFFKILDGRRKYWLLFSPLLSITTQIHILGYVFAIFTFLPLMIIKKIYPKGRILFFSLILFLLPQLPIIIYEIKTRFSLSQTILLYGGHLSSNFSANSLGFSLTYLMKNFFKASNSQTLIFGLYISVAILLVSTFLRFFIKRDSINLKWTTNIRLLMAMWCCSSFLIFLLSEPQYERNGLHMLVFIFPTLIFILSTIIKMSLSYKKLLPIVWIFLVILTYGNITDIISYNSIWKTPTLQDHEKLAGYFKETASGKNYTLEIPEITLQESVFWVFNKYQVPLPKRVNGLGTWYTPLSSLHRTLASSQVTPITDSYVVTYTFVPPIIDCRQIERFGQLKIYRC